MVANTKVKFKTIYHLCYYMDWRTREFWGISIFSHLLIFHSGFTLRLGQLVRDGANNTTVEGLRIPVWAIQLRAGLQGSLQTQNILCEKFL